MRIIIKNEVNATVKFINGDNITKIFFSECQKTLEIETSSGNHEIIFEGLDDGKKKYNEIIKYVEERDYEDMIIIEDYKWIK